MRRAVLADTGPLYALVDPSDQYHGRAQGEFRRLKREKLELAVAYPILLEAYTLVLRHLGRPLAQAWLKALVRGAGLLNPSGEDYLSAVARVQAYRDQPITLFDAALAILAERLELPVWTYDHHFDMMRVPVWR